MTLDLYELKSVYNGLYMMLCHMFATKSIAHDIHDTYCLI